MAETVHTGQSSSLRRLVPRIFSRSQRRDDVEQLIRTVRSQNLPWTNVLRYLSIAVPQGVGLTNVAVQGNSALSITAETTDPDWIPAFWARMNESPFFTGAMVTSTSAESRPGRRRMTTVHIPVT